MIELELSRGRNAMGIWQDLVDGHGFRSSYLSVQRFVRKLRGAVSLEARVIVETADGMRSRQRQVPSHAAVCSDTGLESQVCSSTGLPIQCAGVGRLGGSPRVVVLDNLREGVLSPDFYDPGLNPLYRDVLAHYGVTELGVPGLICASE